MEREEIQKIEGAVGIEESAERTESAAEEINDETPRNAVMQWFKAYFSNRSNLIKWIIIAAAFILVLILNLHTEYVSDDWVYMFVYNNTDTRPPEDIQRISSLWDIFVSMKNHWLNCNGRVVVHGLLQIFLALGKVPFRLFNSAVFTFFGWLIYKHAAYGKKEKPFVLLLTYILMWFFLPSWGLCILWASGAANYMWGTAIALAFLLPYRMYAVNGSSMRNSVKNAVLMGVFGLFAGCTMENIGIGALGISILFIIYYRIKNIKIPAWANAGAAASAAGTAFLWAAPGNQKRVGVELADILSSKLPEALKAGGKIFVGILILTAFFIIIKWISNNGKISLKEELLIPLIYFLGAAAIFAVSTVMAAMLNPTKVSLFERIWFTAAAFAITAAGCLCADITFENIPRTAMKRGTAVLSVLMCIVFVSSYTYQFIQINKSYTQAREVIDTVEEAAEKGQKTVTVKMVGSTDSSYDPFFITAYIGEKESSWINMWMAKYYGLDSIKGEKRQ